MIRHSIYRERADSLFATKDYDHALIMYVASIANNEYGLLYSLINGAYCALQTKNYGLYNFCLSESFLFIEQDTIYFKENICPLIFNGIQDNVIDSPDLHLDRLEATKFTINEGTNIVFILGFPRCGTTYLARNLLSTGQYVESLSPEPFTKLLKQSDCFDPYRFWESSLYKFPHNKNAVDIVEKSTHHLLCRIFFEELLERYPDQVYLCAIRDPVARSISAFQFSVMNGGKSNLDEAVQIEFDLIRSLGGASSIFKSKSIFLDYLERLGGFGIYLPILYPSILIAHPEKFYSDTDLQFFTFINVDTRVINGRPVDNALIEQIFHDSRPSNVSSPFPVDPDSKYKLESSIYHRLDEII